MDQYKDAVQHPQTAFTDPVLKSAKIATNGMGLPIALGGGFALTYRANAAPSRRFAIRCFHKEARDLEARYAHIDTGLRAASGPYFVGFEFQPGGVLVNGRRFPIVKMDWVDGDTLGSFLENNFSDKSALEKLRNQFEELERFLRTKRIAHGDLQNGNVLVKSGLKLIDYDGMYVPSLPSGKGTELGHKHFQHPKRSAEDFGPEMDRFSFIIVELSLRALAQNPRLFPKYSNGENIILTANDFIDPDSSPAFAELRSNETLTRDATNLASICVAAAKNVPTLAEFLAGQNIPAAPIVIRPPSGTKGVKKVPAYVGAYEVVDAANYNAVAKQVGDKVELVGLVVRVHSAKTKYGKPFCFVFFDNSKRSVKLNIWSEGVAELAKAPDQTWIGTWLSVQGLVDPAYTSRYGTSLSITVTSKNQIREIKEAEARRRLRIQSSTAPQPPTDNRAILNSLATKPRAKKPSIRRPAPPSQTQTSQSKNQAILKAMNPGLRTSPPTQPPWSPAPRQSSSSKGEVPWGWIVFGAIVLFLLFRSLR